MFNELMLAVSGAIGVGAGYAYASVRAIEDRCSILRMAQADIEEAISVLDSVLADETAPSEIKRLSVLLLAGYSDAAIGSNIIHGVLEAPSPDAASIAANPIEIAMNDWAQRQPLLHHNARQAFGVLTMGLAVIHLGDRVKLMKVEQRAVKDPLWTQISFHGLKPALN